MISGGSNRTSTRLAVVIALTAGTIGVVGSDALHVAAVTSPTITQVDLLGPAGSSERFGEVVTVLTDGNYVVTDPGYDFGGQTDVGATHLYNGADDTVISTLHGTSANDQVGSGGVVALTNGNYVVHSPLWDNTETTPGTPILDAGAATWGNGATGVTGAVTIANSLHGISDDDQVGSDGVTALSNGNYVVASPDWNNTETTPGTPITDAGAATWGNGTTGTTGAVSITNSLYGSTTDDLLTSHITALTNGNYVAASPHWDNNEAGTIVDAGAVTWGNGVTGTVGAIGSANSLHGITIGDQVGDGAVTVLANSNYVVASPDWNNTETTPGTTITDAGAATWGNGTTGTTGPVTIANSLHGTTTNDRVGNGGVTALTNDNYVVTSSEWQDTETTPGTPIYHAGAATWGNGTTGTTGPVSTTNSLHGTSNGDLVGNTGVTALANGNYVVRSSDWNNTETTPGTTITYAGAATWGNGTTGTTGPVTIANSLYGTTNGDIVGNTGVTALANGNYVVRSPFWNNTETTPGTTIADAGAATWGDGSTGIAGPVSTTNSLYGTTDGDLVGNTGVTALVNSNYIVHSPRWNNTETTPGTTITYAGAATWGDGSTGITGAVSTTNSLHGTTTLDFVALDGVTPLTDGNYIVGSRLWNGPEAAPGAPIAQVGAATWADGGTATSGPVTTSNSLHGSAYNDRIGEFGTILTLADGDYIVASVPWNDGANVDAGAVTFGAAQGGVSGPVTASNSVIGTPPGTIDLPGNRLTANDALPVPTNQGRVLLMQLDRSPMFTSTPPDVTAATAPGELTATVTFGTPTAADDRSTPTVTCNPASGSSFDVGTTTVTCTATDSAGLTDTTSFTVTVTATPPPSTTQPEVPPTPVITSSTPARFADTRPTGATLDGLFEADGKRMAGSEYRIQIGGRGDVPGDATAAVINLTAVAPVGTGFVTAHPCIEPRPLSSLLNSSDSVNLGNEVIAPLAASGEICLYTSNSTHLTVDVTGYIEAASPLQPVTPSRFLDTRPTGETIDDMFAGGTRPAAASTTRVRIAGRGDVPADAGAAIVNVTAVGADGVGYVTAHPCLAAAPNAASLNYVAGVNRGNELIVDLDADGDLCLFTSAGTHLTADVVGYLPGATDLTPTGPARLLDTRPSGVTIDGTAEADGKRGAGTQLELQITGRGNVPVGAGSAVINVTAVAPEGVGFVTVHPCVTPRPNTASLNHIGAVNGGNEIIAELSADGTVCLYTSANTHLTADIVAYTTL